MPTSESKQDKTNGIRLKRSVLTSKNLEDYKPGASRKEVFQVLKKVATTPRPSRKHVEPPVSTSK